jgi:hypothetical protein
MVGVQAGLSGPPAWNSRAAAEKGRLPVEANRVCPDCGWEIPPSQHWRNYCLCPSCGLRVVIDEEVDVSPAET